MPRALLPPRPCMSGGWNTYGYGCHGHTTLLVVVEIVHACRGQAGPARLVELFQIQRLHRRSTAAHTSTRTDACTRRRHSAQARMTKREGRGPLHCIVCACFVREEKRPDTAKKVAAAHETDGTGLKLVVCASAPPAACSYIGVVILYIFVPKKTYSSSTVKTYFSSKVVEHCTSDRAHIHNFLGTAFQRSKMVGKQ